MPSQTLFDVITMFHVIEHLWDPVAALAAAASLLKPSGILVVETPNVESWPARIFGRHWVTLDAPRHLALFSENGLSRSVRRAGFDVLRLASYSPSTLEYGESLRYAVVNNRLRRRDPADAFLPMSGVTEAPGGMTPPFPDPRSRIKRHLQRAENFLYRAVNLLADRWGAGCNLLLVARWNPVLYRMSSPYGPQTRS
jgi:SAM-dependent methyltransferase